MGGGDLNLKKSWHPSTFHNQEKLWKAEQRHDSEQKKIAQLQQELREERMREETHRVAVDAGVIKKKDDRVDWLYSGPGSHTNREEYLLGKKIDRAVDPALEAEQREKEALASGPGALFVPQDNAGSSVADLAVKVREDPLFLIRQREEQAKRTLASNPIKMKKLQELLKEKRSKKHKKSKSKKKSRSSPEPEPDRYLHLHSKDRDDSDRHRRHERSHGGGREKRREDAYDRRLESERRDERPEEEEEEEEGRRHFTSRHHQDNGTDSRPRAKPSRYQPYQKARPQSHTRRMDSEELQRRRDEMMALAEEHGKEREKRLRQHEAEEAEEQAQSRERLSQDFLKPLREESITSSQTLEDRIHRSIGSVQRTSAKLSSHFMKK